jgi:trehalose 6-phosphate synthase/phosphatase
LKNFFIFQALRGMAATFRIASSNIIKTAAERRLPSTDSVLTMLKWVERHFMNKKPKDNPSSSRAKKNSFKEGVGFPIHMSFDLTTSPVRSPRSSPIPSPYLSPEHSADEL